MAINYDELTPFQIGAIVWHIGLETEEAVRRDNAEGGVSFAGSNPGSFGRRLLNTILAERGMSFVEKLEREYRAHLEEAILRKPGSGGIGM